MQGLNNDAKLDAIREETRLAAEKRQAELAASRRKPQLVTSYSSVNQLLALVGTVGVFLGMFLPILTVPILGGAINLIETSGGIPIVILSVLGGILTYKKHYRFHWLLGLVTLASLTPILKKAFDLKAALADKASNAETGMAGDMVFAMNSMMQKSIHFDIGLPILIIGACLLLAASFYKSER